MHYVLDKCSSTLLTYKGSRQNTLTAQAIVIHHGQILVGMCLGIFRIQIDPSGIHSMLEKQKEMQLHPSVFMVCQTTSETIWKHGACSSLGPRLIVSFQILTHA